MDIHGKFQVSPMIPGKHLILMLLLKGNVVVILHLPMDQNQAKVLTNVEH